MAKLTLPALTNLKYARQFAFAFYTTPMGPAVKVEVFYAAGGINYFNYKNEPKGLYLAVRPVERDVSVSGLSIERMQMTGDKRKTGVKFLLKALPRKNDKALLDAAAQWDAVVPVIAAAFAESTEAAAKVIEEHLAMARA